MTDCGYKPWEIDKMTFPQWERLTRHWQRYPTARTMLKLGFGIKRKDKPEAYPEQRENATSIEELVSSLPGQSISMATLVAIA